MFQFPSNFFSFFHLTFSILNESTQMCSNHFEIADLFVEFRKEKKPPENIIAAFCTFGQIEELKYSKMDRRSRSVTTFVELPPNKNVKIDDSIIQRANTAMPKIYGS